ncbi:MAG: nuclear transport factor 2 family protein [Flavobacteriaceae bacterium]|nr:nuclear transport factor 2 family protein [Flavobacteriaceae bacterium]
MKKILLVFSITLLLFSCSSTTEEQDKKEILTLIDAQEQAWSKHDLEGFMKGYWKSDSLKFYGSNGITYGWDKTLANYKKGYPTPDHSGTLKFKINDITKIEKESYYVMGEYHLTRTIGNANGIFMIIFRKINGEWKIVADTSS